MIRRTMIVLLAAVAKLSAANAPSLILTNGKILTVDDRFTIAQAVAIDGDRIQAVGTNQEISKLAGPNTRRIDLRGRTVTPGLIDNHIHLLRAAWTWALELRFDGIESRKQAAGMLRERVKASKPGEWIYNIGGWTHQQFSDDPRPFTRAELDAIAPDNPVALQESYFEVFLNSRALDALKIQAGAPDPPDFLKGSIERDASGRPTGIVKSDIPATRAVANKLPKVSKDQLEQSAAAMVREMNRAGLTAAGVPGCDPDVRAIFEKWEHEGRLNIRSFCIETAPANQIAQMKVFQGDDYIDNIAFGETVLGALHDPMFAVKSDPRPEQLEQWRSIATEVAKAGLTLHVHAELHNTIDAFLDQIEQINRQHSIRNLRWEFAHLNQVNAAQLERMKKLGMYAAVNPWAVINGAIMHDSFGDAAADDLPPLATIQNSGIMWGLGSDGTAANQIRPFTTLYFAVTGKMAGGRKVIRQTISREDALIAHTRKNAFLLFQEDNLGSIQPGKLADLAVLDRDYLTIPADQIKDIRPVMTIVGGRVAFDAAAK